MVIDKKYLDRKTRAFQDNDEVTYRTRTDTLRMRARDGRNPRISIS